MVDVAKSDFLRRLEGLEDAGFPRGRDGVFTLRRANQRSRDGAVRVRIATSIDCIGQRFLVCRDMQELPEGQAKRDTDKPLGAMNVNFGSVQIRI